MVYEAMVIDNSHFFERGTITVRIANFYFGKMNYDLREDFPEQLENNKIEGNDNRTLDWEAKLSAPTGGGRNYGALFIPQINEKGIVTFLNGSQQSLLWLGSLFEPIKDDTYKVTSVNIPSDKLDAEGVDSDGAIAGKHNLDAETVEDALKKNFIYRTKNTVYTDTADDIDWEKIHTTNVVSIGEKEILVRHYAEEDGWNENIPEKYQDIKLHRNDEGKDEINFEVTNISDEVSSKISITDTDINIISTSADGGNSINISTAEDYAINITDVNGNVIIINEDGISLQASGNIDIIADGEFNIINSGDIIISSDGKVILQDDEMGAVRAKELISMIGAFETHGHICPSGPTVGPPTDGTPAPLAPQLIGDKQGMESAVVRMI